MVHADDARALTNSPISSCSSVLLKNLHALQSKQQNNVNKTLQECITLTTL